MSILEKLERKFARYVPENITMILLVGQVLSYVLVYTNPRFYQYFLLIGEKLYHGEIWRLILFALGPVSESLFFVIFAWYFFYMLGTSLESRWGSFRFLTYLLIAYIGNVLFALFFPFVPVRNTYMFTSLFLAFAHLYPNFQLLLFFIIPVKVKWLGYLAWIGLLFTILFASLPDKILVIVSVFNFFVFFSSDIVYAGKIILRGLTGSTLKSISKGKALHICAVCGKNEKDNPDMEIRYCKTCFPETCYCGEHIISHQHKRAVN